MTRPLLVAAVLLLAPALNAETGGGRILELSCVEALVSVDQARLAGVFSFIPEKDSIAAFADLLARDPGALKKFTAKVEKDLSAASGISRWDRDALAAVVTLFGSPLGETFVKPSAKTLTRLAELVQAPVLPLEEITARRKKA